MDYNVRVGSLTVLSSEKLRLAQNDIDFASDTDFVILEDGKYMVINIYSTSYSTPFPIVLHFILYSLSYCTPFPIVLPFLLYSITMDYY